MDIITVNVGQGACAIIRQGNDAIIVDCNIPPSNNTVEFVKGMFSRCLKGYYVRGLVLTGFDDDHAAADGVGIILKKYRPDWVMYPKYFKDTREASNVFAVINQQKNERASSTNPLRTISVRVDKLESRFLHDLSSHFMFELFSPHIEDMDSSNNSSIVMKITSTGLGTFSYLVTGDTERGRWESITRLFGNRIASHVLSAPHHGSINGIDPQALLLISPQIVLISAGVDNQYGHPNDRAVEVYSRVAKVFTTNASGGTSFITNINAAGVIETRRLSMAATS